jgi:LAO/AO transport system kinase
MRSLGEREAAVLAVSAVPPVTGMEDLAAALDAHRERLDLGAARVRGRRLGALADYLAEHGERGLRSLGGRRAATRWLEAQDPGLDEPALVRGLEERAETEP